MPELRQRREQLPDARRARHRGGLSFGYFSLATQRKVTRPPKEDESSLKFASNKAASAAAGKAHSTPLAPTPNAVTSRVMISFGDSATSGKSPTGS